MRKRFSPAARTLVVAATNAAALAGAQHTEAEHFLIALLVGSPSAAQNYLRERGLTGADVELAVADTEAEVDFDDDDAAALAALGFDLPQILHQLEERFGTSSARRPTRRGPRKLSVGFGDTAKQLLSQAVLEASFRDEEIAPEHLLLALLRDPSPTCADLMSAYALSYDDAQASLFPRPESNAS